MAHLVEVQHERGASGGQTFHSLLTASLPPRRGTTPTPTTTLLSRLNCFGLHAVPWLVPASNQWGSYFLSTLHVGPGRMVPGAGWKVLRPHTFCFSADSTEAPKPESSPEPPPGQGRTRAGTQVPVLGPEDDLAGIFLQVPGLSCEGLPAVPPAHVCLPVSHGMCVQLLLYIHSPCS